jgi:hypothetical protein
MKPLAYFDGCGTSAYLCWFVATLTTVNPCPNESLNSVLIRQEMSLVIWYNFERLSSESYIPVAFKLLRSWNRIMWLPRCKPRLGNQIPIQMFVVFLSWSGQMLWDGIASRPRMFRSKSFRVDDPPVFPPLNAWTQYSADAESVEIFGSHKSFYTSSSHLRDFPLLLYHLDYFQTFS